MAQACSFQSDGFGLLNASSQCKHCARVDAVQILKFLLDKAGGNKPLRDKTIKEMLQKIFYEQVEEISVAELLTRFLDSADDISADVNEYVKSQIAALIKFLELNEKKVWCEPNDE